LYCKCFGNLNGNVHVHVHAHVKRVSLKVVDVVISVTPATCDNEKVLVLRKIWKDLNGTTDIELDVDYIKSALLTSVDVSDIFNQTDATHKSKVNSSSGKQKRLRRHHKT
jgi:hypothetical protein